MKKIFAFMFLYFTIRLGICQPAIQWEKCYGGNNSDIAYSINLTSDGGYIIAGVTGSNDGDVTGYIANGDFWLVKIDNSGLIEWEKCLGGTNEENARSIQQTSDGGYIIAGDTYSNDSDVVGYHGYWDYWVVKTDSIGSIIWQKCLGGSMEDRAYAIQQTNDGGYIVAGYTISNDFDVTGLHGLDYDYWIVKLNNTGTMQWQKCLGGGSNDRATAIQQTMDGGFIIAGYTFSNDNDVTGNHGNEDFWVVKIDSTGLMLWQKCLGGTGVDDAYSIKQTRDGGFIVAGSSTSNDFDAIGNHGNQDYLVIKLDSLGSVQWQRCLGGSNNDVAVSVVQTADNGYIVAGSSSSNDGNVIGNHGNDYWIVKLDTIGLVQWQKCLGGSGWDVAHSIQQTLDGGFIVAGYSNSIDGDVTGNHSLDMDYWVVKLSPLVEVDEVENIISGLSVDPNPVSQSTSISFKTFRDEFTTIKIYNLLGQDIKTLLESDLQPREYKIVWDCKNNNNIQVKNGYYIMRISTPSGNKSIGIIVDVD